MRNLWLSFKSFATDGQGPGPYLLAIIAFVYGFALLVWLSPPR